MLGAKKRYLSIPLLVGKSVLASPRWAMVRESGLARTDYPARGGALTRPLVTA
jgi:hypothetical protein